MFFYILLGYFTIGVVYASYVVWFKNFDLKVEIAKETMSRQSIFNKEAAEDLSILALVTFITAWPLVFLIKTLNKSLEKKKEKVIKLYKEGNEEEAIKIITEQIT